MVWPRLRSKMAKEQNRTPLSNVNVITIPKRYFVYHLSKLSFFFISDPVVIYQLSHAFDKLLNDARNWKSVPSKTSDQRSKR